MTIHIATSLDIKKAVQRGVRVPVACVSDNVLVGPCATEPDIHCQQRRDFWGLRGREGTRFRAAFSDALGALKSRQRLVVWASGLWSDRLALWALAAWRLSYRPERPELDVIVVGDAPEDGFSRGFVRVTPADARLGLDQAAAQSRTRIESMARGWRKVSSPAPILFASAARARRPRKELMPLGAYQAGFFPRTDGRALRLSRFDELLFACLDKNWSTPADVFARSSSAGEELRTKWLSLTGDLFLAMRMRQWARHRGPDAALESAPHSPDRIMLEARYRLSKSGHSMRQHGLAEIAHGAPLPVWGATAYDPALVWVVAVDHLESPRVQRL